MPKQASIGWFIAAGFALALIAAAVVLAVASWRLSEVVRKAEAACPVAVAVDFSRPAKTTAPLVQTFSDAHGQALCLELSRADGRDAPWAELTAGLGGTVTIADRAGREIVSTPIRLDQPPMIASFTPMRVGEYRLTVDVLQGAPALAGRQQRLVGSYQLCGVERLPSMIAGLLAAALGLPAAVLSAFVIIAFFRRRRSSGSATD